MKKNSNTNPRSEEGRRILYRLLLLAVAVVYVLVFVLDYLLQLHFTFFLLLSLFGFVIVMLLYMWFRVWNQPPVDESSEGEEEEREEPPIWSLTETMFRDAIFRVNPSTGLTTSCSDAAVELFEAASREELTGIDLTTLFADSFPSEDRQLIREQLDADGRAEVPGTFRTLRGSKFEGNIQAVKHVMEHDFTVRITRTEVPHERIMPGEAARWFEDAGFPMAIVGINYKFARVNRAFCNLTGYNEDELLSMTMPDLLHPDDRKQGRKVLSSLFRGDLQASRRESRIIRRNNEVVWVNALASMSRDNEGHPRFVITLAEDITRQKRTNTILANSRNKINTLVENAEYAMLAVDRRHTIRIINSKLSDMFFTQTGIIVETGFNLLDILPEAFHKDYLNIHRRAFAGEKFILEKTLTINRRRTDIELIVTPVKDEHDFVHSISILGHNITGRKRNEQELIRAREEAIAAAVAKSGFLATMSHEIRTPLNGVIGMGRLLSQTTLTPKQQEFVDSILLSGEALLSVINDILDFSKIESSKMELERKPFAVKRAIEETFDLLASKAIEKNLALHYSIERDVPAYIFGDITRLRQILMNLVSNAIKFTQRGSITISVSKEAAADNGIVLRFDVVDTGVGIPADQIGKLFRSFSQADVSTARTYGGTGLGLAICKNLVELMGGKIHVESVVDQGSDFIFTIRTESVPAEEIPRGKQNGTNKLANSYVLIISDDKTEAALYADYFKRWGMIPQIAEEPSLATAMIRERKDFNLVMIDAQLISIRPMVLAEEIRTISTKEDLPIVLFNTMKSDDMFFDYTSQVISADIPKHVDRSKVLDILISVFSVEEHQRTRDDHAMKTLEGRLGDEIRARVLIAEDNMINQRLAQNIFEGLGYKPVIVSNGLQVIDRLRKESFDIIFMDVQMPEMDGFEATRFIRTKLQPAKRPVIIAMTAFALEGDREKCIEAGMDDYISKPFLIEEIMERIRKWVPEGTTTPRTAPPVKSKEVTYINDASIGRLRELTGESDPAFFREVLGMFIDQADDQLPLIQKALQRNDPLELASQAHKLKGSALNIGADLIAETCRLIELKGRERDMDGMKELVDRLGGEIAGTREELRKIIASS